jgi:hypothetical protein
MPTNPLRRVILTFVKGTLIYSGWCGGEESPRVSVAWLMAVRVSVLGQVSYFFTTSPSPETLKTSLATVGACAGC